MTFALLAITALYVILQITLCKDRVISIFPKYETDMICTMKQISGELSNIYRKFWSL